MIAMTGLITTFQD